MPGQNTTNLGSEVHAWVLKCKGLLSCDLRQSNVIRLFSKNTTFQQISLSRNLKNINNILISFVLIIFVHRLLKLSCRLFGNKFCILFFNENYFGFLKPFSELLISAEAQLIFFPNIMNAISVPCNFFQMTGCFCEQLWVKFTVVWGFLSN